MQDDAGRLEGGRFQLKWTLARKIGFLAALLVAILLANAVYNYRTLGNLTTEFSEVADSDLPATKLVDRLNANSLHEHIVLERLMRLGPGGVNEVAAERARLTAEFDSLDRQFDTDVAAMTQLADQAA